MSRKTKGKNSKNPALRAKMLTRRVTKHGVSRKTLAESDRHMIVSVATEVKVRGNVKRFLQHVQEQGLIERQITSHVANRFLEEMAGHCTQKTLDGYRTALAKVFKFDLNYLAAAKPTILAPRAYRPEQILFLCDEADVELALSIQIAAAGGLRAVELHTITPMDMVKEDARGWLPERFSGRKAEKSFVVTGKGGLRREIRLPSALVEMIQRRRLPERQKIREREIDYIKTFSLVGGHAFSCRFSRLSKRVLGWSTGAHGMRHYFAQARLLALQKMGFPFEQAILILAQELGHFSIANTLKYLR